VWWRGGGLPREARRRWVRDIGVDGGRGRRGKGMTVWEVGVRVAVVGVGVVRLVASFG
jgi:hypothetical protein